MPYDSKAGLSRRARAYVESVEHNLRGLEAVSTGVCPGCEQCQSEYGKKVHCECADEPENEGEPHPCCALCDGHGERPPTMEEFEEQWSSGDAFAEPWFSWGSCGICGCHLGGNREPWHGIDKETGEILHFDDACQDCACYLANGDIPDDEYLEWVGDFDEEAE